MSSRLEKSLRGALFVDFDNAHTRLLEQDAEAAKTFATQPQQWLAWLESSLPLHGISDPDVRRRILVRRCYLNPNEFGQYRPYFVRAGFETVDCPPLTMQGKTSADVHIVLDMVELLDHAVSYDEFIIMSADADFTPVLLKLRTCDRRTAVLTMGPSSAAYRAASDLVIDQDDFLAEALAFPREPEEPQAAGTVPRPLESTPRDASPPSATDEILAQCAAVVRECVRRSPLPLSMAAIAPEVKRNCPGVGAEWLGFGTFKALLNRLDLGPLRLSDMTRGYVYDPERHAVTTAMGPVCTKNEFSQRHPELAELARRVHQLTETPLLIPEHYAKLYEAIVDEVDKNGYHITSVSKHVRDRLRSLQIPVGRQQVNFVLRGIAFAGHRFGNSRESVPILAEKMLESTLALCANAQLALNHKEKENLKRWLVPATPAHATSPAP